MYSASFNLLFKTKLLWSFEIILFERISLIKSRNGERKKTFKILFINSCTCNHFFCWPHIQGVWSIERIYQLRLLPDTGRLERTSCRSLRLHCLLSWSPAGLHCSHWLCTDESFCPISDHKYVNLLNYGSAL